MLCARWLVSRDDDRPGPLQVISDRVFGWLRRGYGRTLDWGLAHSPIVLMFFIGIAAFTVHLYIKAPKSFLPQQDTGQLGGFIRGDDGMSFQIMQPKIEAFRAAVMRDPAVESVAGFIGGGRGINNAQMFVRLKPLHERQVSAQIVAERIRRNLPEVPGARMFLNVDQDIRFGGGLRRRLLFVHAAIRRPRPRCGWGAARPRSAHTASGADRDRGRTGLQPADHASKSTVRRPASWGSRWPR